MSRVPPRIAAPLRNRDFRRLAIGLLTSLLGDGFFRVAIALQVYAVSGNSPAALSAVAITWAVSQALMLPLGGAAADRLQRRRVMIAADLWRGGLMALLGALSLSGQLQLWHMVAIGAGFGAGNGFFNPAATALVPELLRKDELVQANAFLGVAKPGMVWLLGPLLGGAVISVWGVGAAFLLDGATFAFSAAMLLTIRARPAARETAPASGGIARQALEGLRFVRANRWAWTWLAAAGLSTMAFTGPFEVLVPSMLLFDLGMSEAQAARTFALILAAGGLGSIVASVTLGQRDLPRRFVTMMFVAEGIGVAALLGFALMTALWHAVVAGLIAHAMFAVTEITWTTTMQRHVPSHLLGRVASLDWLTSIGLVPIGLAAAGILGGALGARTVLLAAGATGAVGVIGLLMVPGSRALESEAPTTAGLPERVVSRPAAGEGAGAAR